jgi:hypothetical protein
MLPCTSRGTETTAQAAFGATSKQCFRTQIDDVISHHGIRQQTPTGTRRTSARFPVLGVRELAQATVAAQIGVGPVWRWPAIHIDLNRESQARELQEQAKGGLLEFGSRARGKYGRGV